MSSKNCKKWTFFEMQCRYLQAYAKRLTCTEKKLKIIYLVTRPRLILAQGQGKTNALGDKAKAVGFKAEAKVKKFGLMAKGLTLCQWIERVKA